MILDYLNPYTVDGFRFLGCHVFSEGENHFLLSENGCAMIIDDILLDGIKTAELPDGLKIKLLQHGLAYVQGKEIFRCEKKIDIRYFIIDLTKRCNFNCIYCFRDFQDHSAIDKNVLDDVLWYIIRYCEQNAISRIGVQLWGGEPLLALEQIGYVAEFFGRAKLNVSFDIETNGSLITEEIAERLHRWGIHVGVSLDGTPLLQNRQRPFASGAASAEAVEAGIRNLQKYYGNDIGGITVVTRHNFRYIKEMLDYFIYHLHLHSMKFNLVKDNSHASEKRLALTADEITWFAEELMEYLLAYRYLGAEFSEGNIEVRLKNLLQRSRISCCISSGCQGGSRMVSFDQAGNIFPCEMMDFPEEKIGSIYDGKVLEEQIEQAMRKNRFFLPKKQERCEHCPWWCYCGGGCSSRNRYLNRDGQIDEVECALNRVIYPKLIEGMLNGYIGLEVR